MQKSRIENDMKKLADELCVIVSKIEVLTLTRGDFNGTLSNTIQGNITKI